ASLAILRDLLAPGGVFIAVEPEPNPLWDVVFGQSSEWWRSDARGEDVSPLHSSEEWRAGLAAAGIGATDAAPSAWPAWPCGVVWGTAPPATETARSDPTNPGSVLVVAADTAFSAAVQDRLHEAGHGVTLCDPSDFIDADRPDQRIAGDGGSEIVLFL